MFANELKWVLLTVPSPFETRPINEKKEIKPEDERETILSIVNFNTHSSSVRSGNENVWKLLEILSFSVDHQMPKKNF